MATAIKTLKIIKKNRKYFACELGGYKAQLVINSVSESLEPGQVVMLHVTDLSETNKYGTVLKFDPLAVLTERDAEALLEAQKWLHYAEEDAEKGLCRTNAIEIALSGCGKYEHLASRFSALQSRVFDNKSADAARDQAWEQARAQEKAARQDRSQVRSQMRVLYPLCSQPDMETSIRLGSRVVVFESTGEQFRINEDHPSYAGSHLLGHEGDYGCYCYYRLATSEEVAELEAEEAEEASEREALRARKRALDDVKSHIEKNGERPDGVNSVVGERLVDSQDIYGFGEWFVVTQAHIWYVQNRGADGDDWSRNNVRTSGAGAIGYRVAYTEELAQKLRDIDSQI